MPTATTSPCTLRTALAASSPATSRRRCLVPTTGSRCCAQRGFAAMLDHWYQQIEIGKADSELIASYLHGHRLAEQLVALADKRE